MVSKKTKKQMRENIQQYTEKCSNEQLVRDYKIYKYAPWILVGVLVIVNYIAFTYRIRGISLAALFGAGIGIYVSYLAKSSIKAEMEKRNLKSF